MTPLQNTAAAPHADRPLSALETALLERALEMEPGGSASTYWMTGGRGAWRVNWKALKRLEARGLMQSDPRYFHKYWQLTDAGRAAAAALEASR